jgi:choline dehydrogenase
MLSGIGPADHLASHGIDLVVDAPEVGENLQDHLVAGSRPRRRRHALRRREARATRRYLTQRRGMLTSNVAEAYGFVRTPVADETGAPADLPDIEIIFAAAPYVGEGFVPLPAEGLTVGAILLQPRSRGTIRLASADPADAAVIDPAYLSDPEGSTPTMRGARRVRATHRDPALGAVTTGGWVQPEGGETMTPPSGPRHPCAATRTRSTTRSERPGWASTLHRSSIPSCGCAASRPARRGCLGHADRHPRPHQRPAIVIGERAADLIRGA